jgi:uncharacterized protein
VEAASAVVKVNLSEPKRMLRALLAVVLLAVILCLAFIEPVSCQPATRTSNRPDPRANHDLPMVKMAIGGRDFTLEIADTYERRQIGLMYRDSMPEDRGMIFVFKEEKEQSFWMGNCRFSIDAIYVDAKMRIVSFVTMKVYTRPDETTEYPSDGPAKWVVELNGGMAEKLKLKKGDLVQIPPEAINAAE